MGRGLGVVSSVSESSQTETKGQVNFNIEQVALFPPDPERAKQLLADMGLTDWAEDVVLASGVVKIDGERIAVCPSIGQLSFNYQALNAARELEVLHYTEGKHWMMGREHAVSHLGMHCKEAELTQWREFFAARQIGVAQELWTQEHSNPAIQGKRWYHYVIFDTRPILGVDLKFIVRDNGKTVECLVCGTQKLVPNHNSHRGQEKCFKCGEMTNHYDPNSVLL